MNSTTITWSRSNLILGEFKPPKPANSENPSPSYNLTSYSNNGVGLIISFLTNYNQYHCNITTPGQEISLLVNVVARSDYQLQIVAPYSATESKRFILQCIATYKFGGPSSNVNFVWYRMDRQPQRLGGQFLL